jgi:cell division protein FtsB
MTVSLREKMLAAVAVALGLGALGFAYLGGQGLPEVRRLRAEKRVVTAEIGNLRDKKRTLEQKVADLRDNRKAIEAKARSELGMVREGETVFLLPERHGRKP